MESFLQECRMYLRTNRRVYEDDEDKITFILSHMTEGSALIWKETFQRHITDEEGDMEFPTLKEFIGELLSYFQPANTTREAAHKLSLL